MFWVTCNLIEQTFFIVPESYKPLLKSSFQVFLQREVSDAKIRPY